MVGKLIILELKYQSFLTNTAIHTQPKTHTHTNLQLIRPGHHASYTQKKIKAMVWLVGPSEDIDVELINENDSS